MKYKKRVAIHMNRFNPLEVLEQYLISLLNQKFNCGCNLILAYYSKLKTPGISQEFSAYMNN